ncbi:MAG TPA: carboxypeptidase regulatory-like domain-containing protein, partial [Gemmatimonadaceae bacterium]|nr:carboxypeptidase regulatory-like domain-containing protein [Gemmatimonadaceae bacterium]
MIHAGLFRSDSMSKSSRMRVVSRGISRISSAIVVVGLTVTAAAAAQAQRTGSIQGTITSADTHGPIAGARVAIASPTRVAISDARGAYVLRDVPAGRYVVRASAIGQRPDSGSVVVGASGSATLDFALKEGSLL